MRMAAGDNIFMTFGGRVLQSPYSNRTVYRITNTPKPICPRDGTVESVLTEKFTSNFLLGLRFKHYLLLFRRKYIYIWEDNSN